VARLGGDAFGILLSNVGDRADMERRVARYSERFAEPFGTGDRDGVERVHLSASIGIACAPDDAENLEQLLAHADVAMYGAKEAARGRWWFFDPAVEASFDCARQLRSDLATALVEEDFVLHFQPEVDLVSGAVVGAEALIRWNHPQRGLLMPSEFIPFAEEHGLLRSVGAWVIREAAVAARRLVEIDPSFRVWINLSPTELTNPALNRQLAECGSLQRSLGIEIRQTSALRRPGGQLASLSAFKRAGLQIAIDDFGTGTLPLSELKYFPIDVVKLDRSFISGLPHDRRDREIVEAVLDLGARFGFTTLAKGIETGEQARVLRDAGCNRGQGYYFGRPMPLDDIVTLLRTRATAITRRIEAIRANNSFQSKVV
jgi:predicted signal transduction protein with EAL and GGDEF domain